MTKHKRLDKTVQVETCLGLEYSTLAELKDMVEGWITMYGKDAWLAQYPDPYGNDYYWAIDKKVPETDAEYDARVANLKKFEQSQEERDRAEFERLSKKFGTVCQK
jgi:hypothetical protein